MFEPGERVLCVKGGWGQFGTGLNPWGVRFPHRGHIYHVRRCWQVRDSWWVLLEEIVNSLNQSHDGPVEPVFQGPQFVPVKKTDTDISVFDRIRLRQERARTVRPRPKVRERT